MSTYDDDMARGHLENGEPLEALYGTGPWSDWGRPDQLPDVTQCHVCGGRAWDLGKEIDCENCGKIEVAA